MKKILVTGAGGSPATNFVRSLMAAPEKIHMVGTECDKYNLLRSEADKNFLVPKCDDRDYIDVLNQIIDEERLEVLHVQNDSEMQVISEKREALKAKTFLPHKNTVKTCLDKLECYKKWSAAGIKQPKTMLLKNEEDLKTALDLYQGKVWIRDTTGAGGRGSLPATDFKIAKAWVDFKSGWGKYTAAECLEPESITWQSIWKDGELVVAQGRKRLYWELAKLSPSGITGVTGAGITVSDAVVDRIAQEATFAIDKKPNGIFSVDLTYDKEGIPNPTEINIGRFFTTHEFFTRAGLNMPYIFIKLVYGERLPEIKKKINPLPDNLAWVRGVDFVPVFTDMGTIENSVKALEERRKRLRSK